MTCWITSRIGDRREPMIEEDRRTPEWLEPLFPWQRKSVVVNGRRMVELIAQNPL